MDLAAILGSQWLQRRQRQFFVFNIRKCNRQIVFCKLLEEVPIDLDSCLGYSYR